MIAVPARFNATTFFVDRHVAEGRGDKVAFFHDAGSLTYAGLQELVNRTGNALLDLGVRPEQRVLCLLLDSPEFLGAFWGAIKIGAIPIPANTMMRADDYLYFLDDSRAPVAIVSEALLAEAGPALAKARYLRHVIVAGRASGTQIAFRSWIARASARLEPFDSSKDDPAFWLYSSGSTGRPKGAVHLQHDMVVCSDTYALEVLGMTEADRTVSAAKLFFAYGLGNNMYFPLRVGGQGVLYPHRPTPDAMFELIHRHRPTLFFGIPTLYAAMLQVKEAEKRYDLSCLRFCISAGEALPEELYRRWQERFGVEILDAIGATETIFMFVSNRPGRSRAGSSGTPSPGVEVRLLDAQGQPVPDGTQGVLWVKTPSAATGYWKRLEHSRRTFVGDWFRTGDAYVRDADGFYTHCGREDDFFKVAGQWVMPAEVEAAMLKHPAVLEAGVVGAEEASGLIKTFAFVVPREETTDAGALTAELKRLAESSLPPHQRPREIRVVRELPRTATGKLQRFRLKEDLEAH